MSPAGLSYPRYLANRLSERATGLAFRGVTRLVGLRPEFVPSHLRRQLAVIGVDSTILARVLRNVNQLSDWPYAWEAEGDRCMADSDFAGAVVAYYVGQRVLVQDTPLKRRLYGLSVEAYLAQPRHHPLEVLNLRFDDTKVAGYLQLPTNTQSPAPLILVVPGVGTTKEEFEPFCEPFLSAGYAVARIDMPGFGQTEGVIDASTPRLIPAVLEQLKEDARIDSERTHLFGVSLGAFWSLHAAARTKVDSVVCVSGPHRPHTFFDQLPPMQVEALVRMTGLRSHRALLASMRAVSLGPIAPTITTPVRIFHGTADQTVPVSEAYSLSKDLQGLRTVTIYDGVHHNCLEHFDQLIDGALAWFADPDGVTSHHALSDSARFTHSHDSARTISLLPGLAAR